MRKKINSILVIGSNGMLGYTVSQYFKRKKYKVVELTRDKFDIDKDRIERLSRYLKKVDVVINCAGIIKPRIKKISIEEILKVNSIFPRNLAKLANKYKSMCFHVTSDCVYSGKKGSYREKDYYDGQDIYGLSKAAGDTNGCMTLRTSIIGEEKQNKYSLLEWARSQKGKEIRGFVNHYWNGVTALYLVEIMEEIIISNLYKKGVFHIFSPEIVTKYELLKIINEVYQLNLKIIKFITSQSCNRSLGTIYDLNKKLVKKPLKQQIKELRTFFEIKDN